MVLHLPRVTGEDGHLIEPPGQVADDARDMESSHSLSRGPALS